MLTDASLAIPPASTTIKGTVPYAVLLQVEPEENNTITHKA
jgi:hypothetical protein